MKKQLLITGFATSLSLCGSAMAQDNAAADTEAKPEVAKEESEHSKLTAANALQAEKLKNELAQIRARVAKLKLEKERWH